MRRQAAGLMLVLAAVLAAATAEQVIAAPLVSEQSAGSWPDVPAAMPVSPVTTAADPAASAPPATLKVGDLVMLGVSSIVIALFLGLRWHRLNRAPQRPMALDPAAAIGLLIGMILIRSVGVAVAAWLWGIDLSARVDVAGLTKLALGAFSAQAIGAAVYWIMQLRAKPQSRHLKGSTVKSVLIGSSTLLLSWPVVFAAAALASLALRAPETPIAHDTLRELVRGPIDAWWIVLSILVVIVAPVMEEIMYRGLLQTALVQAGLSRWISIAITSVVFSLMHWTAVEPPALAALFVLSLALGWAYEKTGRLTTSITMHMLFNSANLGLALLMPA